MSKFWKKFSFWTKIRLFLGSVGVTGEITLFLIDTYPVWKIVAAIATGAAILITYVFTDSNNNDIVDTFE